MNTRLSPRFRSAILSGMVYGLTFIALPLTSTAAESRPALVGMGDSIGEGVQAADAAWQTQMFGYLNWINNQMATDLSLPLILSHPFATVGGTESRRRFEPGVVGTNVSVSGATVHSLLYDRADAATTEQINSETDMVLFPRQQTQIEYVESVAPEMVVCWIGNNDALSAATAFGNMNASQLTPLANFEQDYIALVNRLGNLSATAGTKVVFANIPDVTSIGFLLDRAAAEAMTGFPVALPDGHYTSIIGVLLMKALGNADLINDPNFVLDANEVDLIRNRIAGFNAIIQREATRIGMPVVDINTKFREQTLNPPVFFGISMSPNLLRGLFSLDGVHPSNIGHALLANEFIATMNLAFNMNVQPISQDVLNVLFILDPSIDKDGDLKATGRLGVGLLETLAFVFGFTGDADDLTPN